MTCAIPKAYQGRLERYGDELYEFVMKYGKLTDRCMVDFFYKDQWSYAVTSTWKGIEFTDVESLKMDDISNVLLTGKFPKGMRVPREMKAFVRRTFELSLENRRAREDIERIEKETKQLPHSKRVGMKQKKQHEVMAMSPIVNRIARSLGSKQPGVVFDVGSGQGYLDRVIADRFGLRVVAVEMSKHNTKVAEKRARMLFRKRDHLQEEFWKAATTMSRFLTLRRIWRAWISASSRGVGGVEDHHHPKLVSSLREDMQKCRCLLESKRRVRIMCEKRLEEKKHAWISAPSSRANSDPEKVRRDGTGGEIRSVAVYISPTTRSAELWKFVDDSRDSSCRRRKRSRSSSSSSSRCSSSNTVAAATSTTTTTNNKNKANSDRENDEATKRTAMLVGLHACGDLSPAILRLFVGCHRRKEGTLTSTSSGEGNAGFQGICLVPCCYHLMRAAPSRSYEEHRVFEDKRRRLQLAKTKKEGSTAGNDESATEDRWGGLANFPMSRQLRRHHRERKYDTYLDRYAMNVALHNFDTPLVDLDDAESSLHDDCSSGVVCSHHRRKTSSDATTAPLKKQSANAERLKVFDLRVKKLMFRAVMQSYFAETFPEVAEEIYHRRLKWKRSFTEGTFATYALAALRGPLADFVERSFASGNASIRTKLTESYLDAFYARFDKKAKLQLATFLVLRSLIGPVIEGLVLVDRALYVQEAGGMDVSLLSLFDPNLSPRSVAIVATLKKCSPGTDGSSRDDGRSRANGVRRGDAECG
eukprot:g2742.t1